jgi:hypothetical protein
MAATGSPGPEWVLPAGIPFSDLKGRDLEECVYWLVDALGARNLEWRIGEQAAAPPMGAETWKLPFSFRP